MTPRATITLAAAAGLATCARAQEVIVVSYTWSEVIAGTLTPVSSPNSILEPGEGARFGIDLFAMRNGTDAIGQTTTYTPPPPPGTGTIRGIGAFDYNFRGRYSDATGDWSNRAISPILSAGAFTGWVNQGGAIVESLSGEQFVPAGQTADATNPIADAWRGVWAPASFSPRTVNFVAEPYGNQNGLYNSVLVQYATALADPNDPTSGYALYLNKYIPPNFGNGIDIPIAPTPTTAWAAACSLAAAGRRRRR
jgi:hypothetical protein